jgi:glycosyltransferase involved in cell wall biosynthesis
MRILLVNKFARVTGGADRHCLDLAKALRAAGHEVALLSTSPWDAAAPAGAFVPASMTLATRHEFGLLAAGRVARRSFWNRTAAAAAQHALDAFAPDVVHAHKLYPQLSVAPVVIAARRGMPVVQTLHDFEFVLPGVPPLQRRADRLLDRALYVVRRQIHRRAVRAWLAPSRDLAALYAQRGIRAEVCPLPTQPPPGDDPPWSVRSGAVFVGRLASEKGALDMVELARRAPQLHVTVVGDGPLAGAMRERARELPNLELAGAVSRDEVWERARAARVVVIPSHWAEPASLVALEAMAVGTPVVGRAAGGLGEEIAHSGGGVLVGPDASELVKTCLALAGDEGRWDGLSRAGRAHVRAEHSPQRYVQRLEAVYAAV